MNGYKFKTESEELMEKLIKEGKVKTGTLDELFPEKSKDETRINLYNVMNAKNLKSTKILDGGMFPSDDDLLIG